MHVPVTHIWAPNTHVHAHTHVGLERGERETGREEPSANVYHPAAVTDAWQALRA